MQAGTGLSTRTREEPNTLNLLSIEPGSVRVDRYVAADRPVFEIDQTGFFARVGEGPAARWERTERALSPLAGAAPPPGAPPPPSL